MIKLRNDVRTAYPGGETSLVAQKKAIDALLNGPQLDKSGQAKLATLFGDWI